LIKNSKLFSSQATISGYAIYGQAVCFAVLYAIWVLPNTILIRNICLILGAFIGLCQIYFYRKQLKYPHTLTIFLLLALFGWMTFHLLFLGINYSMQLGEYKSVWKRSFLALIFAFGFGAALVNSDSKVQKSSWVIFYLGLLAPILIYFFKFLLTQLVRVYGFDIPGYWLLYAASTTPSPYYIAKTAYMGFCMPVLAIALGQLFIRLKEGGWFNPMNIVYALTVLAIFFVFYQENIKNGMVYGLLFLITFAL
jgi:hypothetical protein